MEILPDSRLHAGLAYTEILDTLATQGDDMNSNTPNEGVTPILVSGAVERIGDAEIAGWYCSSRDVWVIDGPTGPEPIAQSSAVLGATKTLTEVRNEHDDTDVECASYGSTTTFTKVMAEGDDTDLQCASFTSTTTFTRVQAEAEDTDASRAAMLEITTKTSAQIEQEDTPIRLDLLTPHETERGPGTFRIQ